MEGLVNIEITGGRGEIVNHAEGQCYYKNGHHYVLFSEELSEDGKKGGVTFSSRLKISEGEVVLRRSLPDDKGGKSVHYLPAFLVFGSAVIFDQVLTMK